MLDKRTLQVLHNFSKASLKFTQSIKFTVKHKERSVTNTSPYPKISSSSNKKDEANTTIINSYSPIKISFVYQEPPKLFNCFTIFVIHGVWGSYASSKKMPTTNDCCNEVLYNSNKLHLP